MFLIELIEFGGLSLRGEVEEHGAAALDELVGGVLRGGVFGGCHCSR